MDPENFHGILMIPMPAEPSNQLVVRCLSQIHGFHNGQGDFQRRAAYAKALSRIIVTPHQVTSLEECRQLVHIGNERMGQFVVAAANGVVPQALLNNGCY